MIFLYYIQETDKPNVIFKFFNIIRLQADKIILPIKGEKITDKKAEKLAKKTKKILNQTIGKKIVISEQIEKQENYVNLLYTYDFEIMEGRWLFEVLSCKALDYIAKKKNLKKQEIRNNYFNQ